MNNTKKTIEYVNKTKQDAMRFLAEAQEDVALWTMVVNECDEDIRDASNRKPMYGKARLKVMAAIALIILMVALFGCRSTITGCGMILQGGAHIVKGTGDYLVAEGTEK
ncbi:MAG: hypothetical protein MUO31_06585 [Thermodesulfovibrionales bacterium]|nr:hypothetical protein [Thermodesulfovibrionales bacterium]